MANATIMDNDDLDYTHVYAYANGQTGQAPLRSSTSRASYQNAAEIQAWAAGATGGLDESQQLLDAHSGAAFSSDGQWTGISQMPEYLTHSNSSDGSDVWNTIPSQQSHDSMFNGDSNGAHNTHNVQLGSDNSLSIAQGLGYGLPVNHDKDHYAMDLDFTMDRQTYPSPTEDDLAFPPFMNDQSCMSGDGSNALGTCHGWTAPMKVQEMHAGLQESNYISNGWTVNTASVDPSISSQSSHRPSTPLSLPQDHWDEAILGMHPPTVNGSQSIIPAVAQYPELQRSELV